MLVTILATRDDGTTVAVWEYLFTTRGGQGWFKATAGITGVILSAILIIMIICSQPFVRKKGYFEVNVYNITVFLLWSVFYKYISHINYLVTIKIKYWSDQHYQYNCWRCKCERFISWRSLYLHYIKINCRIISLSWHSLLNCMYSCDQQRLTR